jgi:lysozyme
MKYNTSQLLDMLIRDEGLELKVYKDTLGIDTIGAGRNLRDRPLTVAQLQHLGLSDMQDLYDNGITLYGARYILRIDVDIAERELITAHSCVEFLNAPRQMVCVNMAFNLGVPRLKLFKNMWSAIHRKDYDRAADEMLDSRWAKQVKSRATRLSDIMRTGELNG